uniref:Bel1 homeotic protein n=1 Tax=Rhizophora mucronata TaxID=61149 RepID=A0A2P2KWC3_RHIMU
MQNYSSCSNKDLKVLCISVYGASISTYTIFTSHHPPGFVNNSSESNQTSNCLSAGQVMQQLSPHQVPIRQILSFSIKK